jgi:hypothetical protein
MAPEGVGTQEFSFRVTSRDEQRESFETEARFDAPGGSE